MRLLLKLSQAAAGFTFLMLASHCYRIVPSQGPLVRGTHFPVEMETYILIAGAFLFFLGIALIIISLLDAMTAIIRPFEEKTAEIVRLVPRVSVPRKILPSPGRKFPPIYHIRFR